MTQGKQEPKTCIQRGIIPIVMLGLSKDERRPCRVKGSSCSKSTGRRRRGFNVATWMELLQGFRGSRTKCLLRSKAKTYQSLGKVTRELIGARSTR